MLAAAQVPAGLANLICSSLHGAFASGDAGRGRRFRFTIRCGVIQGCPLAAFIFALCFDPVLRQMELAVSPSGGVVRACADDLGSALRGLESLRVLAEIYGDASLAAGLTVKLPKCALVPLRRLTPHVMEVIRHWLRAFLHHWSSLPILPAAKYLGTFLGPAAAALLWQAPSAKWMQRVIAIARVGAPIPSSIRLYNVHALSTLSYLSQLYHPPLALLAAERHAHCRVLHFPPGALTAREAFALRLWSLPSPRSMAALPSFALPSLLSTNGAPWLSR